MFFAPNFLELPLAIAQELRGRDPAHSFWGWVAGSQTTLRRIRAREELGIAPLESVEPLERSWLEQPWDAKGLAELEARLRPGALRRVVVADRQVGSGLVSGAVLPTTSLASRCRDAEVVRRYVHGLLCALFDSFERDRPDLVFVHGVAGATALGLSEVTDALGIPLIRVNHTRVGDRQLLDDSPTARLAPVRRAFERGLRNPQLLAAHRAQAREFLRGFRDKPSTVGYAQWSARRHLESLSGRSILADVRKELREMRKAGFRNEARYLRILTPRERLRHRLRVAFSARSLIRRGPFPPPGELPSRPFAYFPLHFDPESSTMVQAPMHTDQLAVVEALAKSLPLGMDLVVKEHVPMLGTRPAGYYERLARMPGVILASPFEPSLDLIRRAQLTCTITGTAGWEALLLGRPVLVVGDLPYLDIGEGAIQCQDLSRLPDVVPEALALAPANEDKVELYLAALFAESFEMPIELFEGKPSRDEVESAAQTVSTIADQLLARYRELRESSPAGS